VTKATAPRGAEEALAELSELANTTYRALVWETHAFPGFFRWFTPIDELSLLALGSRPSRRPGGDNFLRSLRAIPWVFAWTQNPLPAAGLVRLRDSARIGDLRTLRRLYRTFPFFRSLLENLEMTLAKSSWRSRAGTWSWSRPTLSRSVSSR